MNEFQLALRWSVMEVDGLPAVQVEVGRVFKGQTEPTGPVWCGIYVSPQSFAHSMLEAMTCAQRVWPAVFPADGLKVH